jgi:uncharacterized protein YukJ
MPLHSGYGVVVGSLERHGIEAPGREGRWPHYEIMIGTPRGHYRCLINLHSRVEANLNYCDLRVVERDLVRPLLDLPPGFHRLDPTPQSGALDSLRHPAFTDPCVRWLPETGQDAVQLIQYYLLNVTRIYAFGEPFTEGRGLHNIHVNQGDRPGTRFALENGIWQDGGLMMDYERPTRRLSIFMTRFSTQRFPTDDQGRPTDRD